MRILVSCIPYDQGKSGISVYIRNLVEALRAQGHSLTLLVEPGSSVFFPGIECREAPRWTRRPVISMAYHLFILPFFIRKNAYDFCIIAAANRRAFSFYPLFTVAVVHDLSQYHVENKYDRFRVFYIKKVLPFFVRKAPSVVAISRSTAADLEKFWHVSPDKITLNYNGLSLSPEGNGGWLSKHGLEPHSYLLYISRIEHPGKNHLNLIRAFEMLPSELTSKYRLVLAGSDWHGADAVHEYAEKSSLRDRILFTGFIDNSDLAEAYRNAAAYVFPSFFEGFGLSLIEAMHYGVPCCASDNSSLGEIGKGAALLFPPSDMGVMSESLRRILTDETLRKKLVEAGLSRAAEFDWTLHARKMAEIYERFAAPKDCASVFGCRFTTLSLEETLEEISGMASDASARPPSVCAFINADCLNQYYTNPEYAKLLREADLVMPDGIGIAIAARRMGTPVRANLNGTDMLPYFCRMPYSIYLLGAAPGLAEKAKTNLEREYPGVRIVGADHGYFADAQAEREAIERVNRANPDILLVAMGVPKQEKWIFLHRNELKCRVAMGVGGLFDFASGRIPRAPVWMRKLKIEWIYRLYNEPIRLFRRYIIGNPLFLWRVYLHGSENLYPDK